MKSSSPGHLEEHLQVPGRRRCLPQLPGEGAWSWRGTTPGARAALAGAPCPATEVSLLNCCVRRKKRLRVPDASCDSNRVYCERFNSGVLIETSGAGQGSVGQGWQEKGRPSRARVHP